MDVLDRARAALLAFDAPEGCKDRVVPGAGDDDIDALHVLDGAGAVEAVLDSDWLGNRRWRVRRLTPAGRDIARLIREEQVWSRLKGDLGRLGNPFAVLVAGYRDNIVLAGSEGSPPPVPPAHAESLAIDPWPVLTENPIRSG